jgi:guanine deaminase
MRGYRASLLWFAPFSDGEPARALWEDDGLLVVGPNSAGRQMVQAIGAWQTLRGQFADLQVQDFSGKIIAPGFVDLHVHYPQTHVIGSPADGLLPWLEPKGERWHCCQENHFIEFKDLDIEEQKYIIESELDENT